MEFPPPNCICFELAGYKRTLPRTISHGNGTYLANGRELTGSVPCGGLSAMITQRDEYYLDILGRLEINEPEKWQVCKWYSLFWVLPVS
jgi:hypothetical protein